MDPTEMDGGEIVPFAPDPFGPGAFGRARDGGYRAPPDECDQAFFTHIGSAVASLLTCGILGVGGALVPYLMAKDRRPFMLFHVNQALAFQATSVVVLAVVGLIGAIVSAVFSCLGVLVYVAAPVPWAVSVIYPILIGLRARDGEWSEYPFLGRHVLRDWRPFFK
jgi:uncharacterized Tic20 family protein